jgi:hypothetical protein
MRGSPACEITVTRFGVWRGAVAFVATAALASMATWLATSPLGSGGWVRAGVAVAALAVIALAASLLRTRALTLRWDGTLWSMAFLAPASTVPASGELFVALDLGSFLLLRFLAAGRSGPGAVRWIPVGRRGLEREWHAFRCAVYSPRPAAGSAVAGPRLP